MGAYDDLDAMLRPDPEEEAEVGPVESWDVSDFLRWPAPNTDWLVKGLLRAGGRRWGRLWAAVEGKTSLLYRIWPSMSPRTRRHGSAWRLPTALWRWSGPCRNFR